MEKNLAKLDSLIVKQAIRDVASKDVDTSTKALSYFISKDFKNLCQRNDDTMILTKYFYIKTINHLDRCELFLKKEMAIFKNLYLIKM